MKVLVCGIGRVARHLLRRLGETWQVTVIDKSAERLSQLIQGMPVVRRAMTGDCSSHVILDEAGIGDFDYVLALTDNDKVNHAAAVYGIEKGATHVLALVNEQESQAMFQEAGIRVVLGSSLLAQTLYHYLEDPRIKVTPLSLSRTEIMEVDVSQHFRMVGKRAASLMTDDWKLVAIFRGNRLLFPYPDTVVGVEDRLIIVGTPGIFKPVCDIMECDHPHFPLAYGPGLLLAMSQGGDTNLLIKEAMHLALNTKVKHVTALYPIEQEEVSENLKIWSQSIHVRLEEVEGDVLERLTRIITEEPYGLVVMDPFKTSFFRLLARPAVIGLAHSLPCPLLLTRHTHPYERILVPFNATPRSELALEVAVDLAKQLEAEIAVVVVEEPKFIRGEAEENWGEAVLKRVRDIGHIHKFDMEEIVARGNPVKEIVELSDKFNLMVMGSTSMGRALFYPHVGELLAREAKCSVLIVTK